MDFYIEHVASADFVNSNFPCSCKNVDITPYFRVTYSDIVVM